jgi:hypothetical protein
MKAALERRSEDEIEVWPDMADSVALFFAGATQWRWTSVGMGGVMRTGLDYPSVFAVADRMEIKVTPEVLSDLRTMEAAAVEQWSKRG